MSGGSRRLYLIISVDDARLIAESLPISYEPRLQAIRDRLCQDTGADIEEMASRLKQIPVCQACSIEGQKEHCEVVFAQKQGRRLWRLIERALGIRQAGDAHGEKSS